MRYTPWCPKCGSPLYMEEHHHTPVVGCRCGFRIVTENPIRNFINSQQREFEALVEKRKEAARLAAEENRRREKEAAEVAAIQAARKIEEPTPSQRRRGATSRVECSVCGATLWRRPKEAASRTEFFCPKHRQVPGKGTTQPVKRAHLASLTEQPTETQIRRGAIHPVRCAVCGKVLFRRKSELRQRTTFFCDREHQRQWQIEHPSGVIREQRRHAG